MARRRRARKARANPRRRRARRSNPRRSKRRLRRNPGSGVFARAEAGPLFTTGAMQGPVQQKKKRKKRRKLSKAARRNRARASSLSKRSRVIRKRAKGMKRGIRKSVAYTQAKRLSTLSRVARRGGKVSRSPVYKAMHIKSNPGYAGLIVAAKALAPQAAVGSVAMFGLALGGKKLSSFIAPHLPASISPYAPALSTIVVTGLGYVVADKVAPKYKGAVAIGGLLGAIVQGVVAASAKAPAGSFMSNVRAALLGPAAEVVVPAPDAPAPTVEGFGDYTTVGGRAYADGGLFREIGDYTTVGYLPEARDGGAYSNQRPRRGERDNATEWALSAYPSEAKQGGAYSTHRPRPSRDNGTEWATNGLDDTTEFAPGEGGVLSGGLFRGNSR